MLGASPDVRRCPAHRLVWSHRAAARSTGSPGVPSRVTISSGTMGLIARDGCMGAVVMAIAPPSGSRNMDRREVAPAVVEPNVLVCARRRSNSPTLSPALPVCGPTNKAMCARSSPGRIIGALEPNHAAIPDSSSGIRARRATVGGRQECSGHRSSSGASQQRRRCRKTQSRSRREPPQSRRDRIQGKSREIALRTIRRTKAAPTTASETMSRRAPRRSIEDAAVGAGSPCADAAAAPEARYSASA